MAPAVAVVPVGADNRYGHPDPGVLARMSARGARVLRTDVDGDLAGAGVEAVLDQFLDDGCGALDDLAGGDLVDQVIG